MEKRTYQKVTANMLQTIMKMAISGKGYKEIGDVLGISDRRVANIVTYYDLSSKIKESRLLQISDYLKTHTQKQARVKFHCSSELCVKASKCFPKESPKEQKPVPIQTKQERISAIKMALQRVQELKQRSV